MWPWWRSSYPWADGLAVLAALRTAHPSLGILVCSFHDDAATKGGRLPHQTPEQPRTSVRLRFANTCSIAPHFNETSVRSCAPLNIPILLNLVVMIFLIGLAPIDLVIRSFRHVDRDGVT
jgi:hypothetical protein